MKKHKFELIYLEEDYIHPQYNDFKCKNCGIIISKFKSEMKDQVSQEEMNVVLYLIDQTWKPEQDIPRYNCDTWLMLSVLK